jgi:hypothetical protein
MQTAARCCVPQRLAVRKWKMGTSMVLYKMYQARASTGPKFCSATIASFEVMEIHRILNVLFTESRIFSIGFASWNSIHIYFHGTAFGSGA